MEKLKKSGQSYDGHASAGNYSEDERETSPDVNRSDVSSQRSTRSPNSMEVALSEYEDDRDSGWRSSEGRGTNVSEDALSMEESSRPGLGRKVFMVDFGELKLSSLLEQEHISRPKTKSPERTFGTLPKEFQLFGKF
eukprot:jgi/Galph1/3129/GphlegSOOS_G1822.1